MQTYRTARNLILALAMTTIFGGISSCDQSEQGCLSARRSIHELVLVQNKIVDVANGRSTKAAACAWFTIMQPRLEAYYAGFLPHLEKVQKDVSEAGKSSGKPSKRERYLGKIIEIKNGHDPFNQLVSAFCQGFASAEMAAAGLNKILTEQIQPGLWAVQKEVCTLEGSNLPLYGSAEIVTGDDAKYNMERQLRNWSRYDSPPVHHDLTPLH